MKAETPTEAARRICPSWMSPEGDAHYRDVLKALEEAHVHLPEHCPVCGASASVIMLCWTCGEMVTSTARTEHRHLDHDRQEVKNLLTTSARQLHFPK